MEQVVDLKNVTVDESEGAGFMSALPGRRVRRPSLSNEALLDKAFDLFVEKGFEQTSIEAITATAGIAKRTVYMRYGDKKTLFMAAFQRAIEKWLVPIERLRRAERGTLEESLLAIGQILVDNTMSPAGLRLLRLTNTISARMPEIGAFTTQQGTDPTIAYLAELFRRHLAPESVGFRHALDAAEAFLDLVVGGPANAASRGVERDRAAVDGRIGFSVRLFLHGLQLQPSASSSTSELAALGSECRKLKHALAETTRQLDRTLERMGGGGDNFCSFGLGSTGGGQAQNPK